jgi:hypothetical protein
MKPYLIIALLLAGCASTPDYKKIWEADYQVCVANGGIAYEFGFSGNAYHSVCTVPTPRVIGPASNVAP